MYTSALLNSNADINLNQPRPVSLPSPLNFGLLWFLVPSWQCLLPYILQWCLNLWRLQLLKYLVWKLYQPACSRLQVWHNVQRDIFGKSKWGLALQCKKTSILTPIYYFLWHLPSDQRILGSLAAVLVASASTVCVPPGAQTQVGLIHGSKALAVPSVQRIHFYVRIPLLPTLLCVEILPLQMATTIHRYPMPRSFSTDLLLIVVAVLALASRWSGQLSLVRRMLRACSDNAKRHWVCSWATRLHTANHSRSCW